jgi:hypothetical protein
VEARIEKRASTAFLGKANAFLPGQGTPEPIGNDLDSQNPLKIIHEKFIAEA